MDADKARVMAKTSKEKRHTQKTTWMELFPRVHREHDHLVEGTRQRTAGAAARRSLHRPVPVSGGDRRWPRPRHPRFQEPQVPPDGHLHHLRLPSMCSGLRIHDKTPGRASITDTDGNRDKFRILIEQYIESLPRGLRVGIKQHNRNNLVLMNGSSDRLSGRRHAEARKARWAPRARSISCTPPRSRTGAPTPPISPTSPPRSPRNIRTGSTSGERRPAATATNGTPRCASRTKDDEHTQRLFFSGWFLKEDYSFSKGSPEFKRWWDGELRSRKRRPIAEVVLARSRWEITHEQWALAPLHAHGEDH